MLQPLFVYGTLMDPAVQMQVFGRVEAGMPDVLHGFRKIEIELDGEVFPAIVQVTGESVRGVVIAVSAEELARIDDYESDAYERIEIGLQSGRFAQAYKLRG